MSLLSGEFWHGQVSFHAVRGGDSIGWDVKIQEEERERRGAIALGRVLLLAGEATTIHHLKGARESAVNRGDN